MNLKHTLLLSLLAFTAAAQEPLTNTDVVRMVQQQIPAATIIQAIRDAPAVNFRIAPEFQPDLEKAGVPRPVVDAMIRRVMADESRSPVASARPRSDNSRPSPDTMSGPRAGAENSWVLSRGHGETVIRGGFNGQENYQSYAVGTGFAFGLNRFAAVVGEYNYNHVGFTVAEHEVTGGIRIGGPGQVSPYAILTGGIVHATYLLTEPAVTGGFGVRIGIRPRFGLEFDGRAIQARYYHWYARGTVGLYVHF